MIEPCCLYEVKLGTVLRALAQVKQFDKLIKREQLRSLLTGIPAKQSQEVYHSLGQIALLAITAAHLTALRVMPLQGEHRETQLVAITLRQFAIANRFQQQRQMCEARHSILPTESTVQQHVQGSAWQPFLATDYVCHLHQMVVHNVCQMICWQVVSTLVQHLIVQNA